MKESVYYIFNKKCWKNSNFLKIWYFIYLNDNIIIQEHLEHINSFKNEIDSGKKYKNVV